ncbi:MAG TPA: hypothetical protein VFJ57_00065 [Solirubrobacterales bacterium]|nr:hypothetical protein [Solirubrobacterales bacterium]
MATEDPTRNSAEDPASEDRRTERAVLAFVLDQHPTLLTEDELTFALDPKDLAEKDAIARAIRELAGAGLLRLSGYSLTPTRPALYFAALEIRARQRNRLRRLGHRPGFGRFPFVQRQRIDGRIPVASMLRYRSTLREESSSTPWTAGTRSISSMSGWDGADARNFARTSAVCGRSTRMSHCWP